MTVGCFDRLSRAYVGCLIVLLLLKKLSSGICVVAFLFACSSWLIKLGNIILLVGSDNKPLGCHETGISGFPEVSTNSTTSFTSNKIKVWMVTFETAFEFFNKLFFPGHTCSWGTWFHFIDIKIICMCMNRREHSILVFRKAS